MTTRAVFSRTIVVVTTGLDYGGAEIQLVSLARRLKARGWVVHLISLTSPKAFAEELERDDIIVHWLGMRSGKADPLALARLAFLIRSIRPGIVHSHMVHANVLTRVGRILAWVPICISTIHSIEDGGRLWQLAYRITDWLCDMTTHVSRTGMERYVKIRAVPRAKIRHVPNGIDVERFRPRADVRNEFRTRMGLTDNFVWIAVGRFEAAKDYANLVNAFNLVSRERDDSVLLIVGRGIEEPQVRLRVRTLGLEKQVRFLGLRKDIPNLLNVADAYVLSSQREGLPLVLLEAGASGLPVVTTDVGGTSEIVAEGKTGFLVPIRSAQGLAAGMLRMAGLSVQQRALMGAEGRARVNARYAFPQIVDEWERLYIETATKKGLELGERPGPASSCQTATPINM
jgi:glycosyltransferase involved in cell wall biosynthesis